MLLPLAKISVRQLEMYPLWKESVDYLELETRLLIAHMSSMPATAMHSSEQCTARVPTLLCPTGLTSQRTMPASTFLENTPSPRQTRRINNSRNNDKQEEEEEGACEKEEEEGRGDSFGHVAARPKLVETRRLAPV